MYIQYMMVARYMTSPHPRSEILTGHTQVSGYKVTWVR